jgi:dethiobiotin synthetase
VLKPVATGLVQKEDRWFSEDAEHLIEAIGAPPGLDRDRVAPIVLEKPLAPPLAAREEGWILQFAMIRDALDRALDWWRGRADAIIVEGIGGLLCPLAEGATVADLAIELDYPLVIVAHRGLGTLNHTLLSIEAARRRGLRIAGVVLNGTRPATDGQLVTANAEELARRMDGIPLLANVGFRADPERMWQDLCDVDWYGWARPPRGLGRPAQDGSGS